MTQKLDLRIRRTLLNIRDAFLELVIEHGFDAITIQMIADRAMINRATFYRHYTDKFDLADQLVAILTPPEVTPGNVDMSDEDVLTPTRTMLEHCAQNRRFYLMAVSSKGIPQFREQMLQYVENGMRDWFAILGVDKDSTNVPFDLTIRYLATAQMGFVEWWLREDMPFSAEVAAQHLLALSAPIAATVFNLPIPAQPAN